MTFEEVLSALREGKKIRRTFWWEDHYLKLTNDGIVDQKGENVTFGVDDLFCSDWEIVKEAILNDKEREYLKVVCELFKERVVSIARFKLLEGEEDSYLPDSFIQINLINPTYSIALPFQSEKNWFKGMEQGKKYTLKNLGISYE